MSFIGTQALADELGKEGAGVVVSQVTPSPFAHSRAIAREFVEATKQSRGDVHANFSSMEGYLAAKLVVEGLRLSSGVHGLSRESFITGLESMGSQSLGGFAIKLGPNEHVASKFVELSMLTCDGRVRT